MNPIAPCKKITVKAKPTPSTSLEKYRIEVLELKKQIKEMQKQIFHTNKLIDKLGKIVMKA